MADLAPAVISSAPAPSLLSPLTDPAGGPALTRLKSFTSQGPVRRMLPWFGGVAGIGLVALAWATLSPAPQRVLYTELNDGERAKVVSALDKAQIAYAIDNQTGTLTVGEDDLYKARMLVAEDGALAAPAAAGLDALPMGASRTLEGEHLRSARERELTLSIMEIDGVEAVRVHLAQAEKSVFVRDNVAPSASVMVRLARGRSLGDSQVAAIVNLVAGSVPGMSADSVRLVDQHGRLLTAKVAGGNERIEMQGQLEEKLRAQLDALLTPMLGAGNFSNEVQVELDMDQVTSARETNAETVRLAALAAAAKVRQAQATGEAASARLAAVLAANTQLTQEKKHALKAATDGRACLSDRTLRVLNGAPGLTVAAPAAGVSAPAGQPPAGPAAVAAHPHVATDADVSGWVLDAGRLHEACRQQLAELAGWINANTGTCSAASKA